MQTKDIAQLITTIIVGSGVVFVLCGFLIGFLFFYQRKKYQYFQEKSRLKTQFEQEILESQLEVQNQTLQQVGQDLHDNIGQILAVARLNLSVLENKPHHASVLSQIQDTNELLAQAIADLRALTKNLDNDFIKDFGLHAIVEHELQRLQRTGRYQTQLDVVGTVQLLDQKKQIILFRVFQEIVNNILKHAGATHIVVNFKYLLHDFEMAIEDNGRGFDTQATPQSTLISSGAGLRNIRRRVDLLKGHCALASTVGQGTTIRISIPTSSNNHSV